MPPQTQRHTLTIKLDRKGDNLVRTYLVPGRDEVGTWRSPFDAIGADYRAGAFRGLRALHGVLARGDGAELEASLTRGALDRAGAALFEALFGEEETWGPVLRAAFRQSAAAAQPDPCRYPLRVRILTRHAELQGLPWRAAMWSGRLLIDEDWTFEVCFDPSPALHVDFRAPGSILVVAPDFDGMEPLGTGPHLDALRRLFEGLAPGHSAAGRFEVVGSTVQLERALRAMRPDILYFFGHGDVTDGQLELALGDGRRETMLMRDFARLVRKTPPRVVFLNGCQTGQAGWHSAGAQLMPDVPVVIANATTTWADVAARFAADWFAAWLRDGLDPVAALHHLGGRSSTMGFAWVTPVVHAEYDAFTTISFAEATDHLGYFPADRLDREEQRSRVFGYISDLARDPRRRAMASIAYGAPGNSLERLPSQIIARVESDAGERLHVRHVTVRFPEQRALGALAASLEQRLKLDLHYDPSRPILELLRGEAPERDGDAVPILWLDWGVFGEPPQRQPELDPEQLTAWLKFVRDRIAVACPEDMRVVATLALELETSRHDGIKDALAELEADMEFRAPPFRLRTIPPLRDVELSELLDYLEHVDCPITHELAKLIFGKTRGHYEQTVTLLQKGPPAWYPLRDELLRERDAGTKVARRW